MIAPGENLAGRPRSHAVGGLLAALASEKKIKFVYGKCSMSSNTPTKCPLCGREFTGLHQCELKGGK